MFDNETEVLNQGQDMTAEDDDLFADELAEEDEDLFADWTPEDSDKPTDDEESSDQTVDDGNAAEESKANTDQQVAGSHDQPAFMTIKYNKEARNLSKDEAITLAQKGMNYDEIYARYESLKGSEGTIKEISRLAKANGLSVEEYMKGLSDTQESFEIEREMDTLREQYPNTEDAALKEIAVARLKANATNLSRKQEDDTNARKHEIGRQMDVFMKKYPNLNPTKLDQGVYALMKQGYTMLEAYEIANADRIKAEEQKKASLEKIDKQNKVNRKRSLGSTSNNGYDGEDEFLKELFSD